MLKHLMRGVLMAPQSDDDEGGTTTDEAPPPPAGDGLVSRKEADAQAAKLRRSYERKLKEQEQRMEKLEKQLEEVRKAGAPPPPPIEDPTVAGQLELIQKKHEREREEMLHKIGLLEQDRDTERKQRRQVERDRQIDDALLLAGVADSAKVAAARYFLPNIEWDEVDACWMFKTRGGNLVSIAEGVAEEMPDFFKAPRTNRGGAGTTNGTPPRKAAVQKELETAQAKLKELQDTVKRQPQNNGALQSYNRHKRVVADLERKLTSMK